MVVEGEAAGRKKEGADAALKTKTPHDNVGKNKSHVPNHQPVIIFPIEIAILWASSFSDTRPAITSGLGLCESVQAFDIGSKPDG